MKRYFRNMTLFHKFALTIILLGLMPMLFLSMFISNKMIREYRKALEVQYEHAAYYVKSSVETMLDSYNTISKLPYNYNYGNEPVQEKFRVYDNLRQILSGENYEPQNLDAEREKEMDSFLKYTANAEGDLVAVHFVGEDSEGNPLDFHYSDYATYFKGQELFEQEIDYADIDKSSNKLMLLSRHHTNYFSGLNEEVFTVARNYFDIRSQVGDAVYVGTLFLDVRVRRLDQIFQSVRFSGAEEFYIVNDEGTCFYASPNVPHPADNTGSEDVRKENAIEDEIGRLEDMGHESLVLDTEANKYGLSAVIIMDTEIAFAGLRAQRNMMYVILGISTLALVISSVFFSKRLVNPIHDMMEKMEQVEKGNFDICLPVSSSDEIGILSARFNQMNEALKEYINKSYVAQIRQTEAELTALKSQIYPHFLYNTLEIIRMTALENQDLKVSEMIEALSVQIHYLIGTVQDLVPLEEEIQIIRKYVYLLNCRISGRIQLAVSADKLRGVMIPKLILQPIVENAYVHGIKPKKGYGSISIEMGIADNDMEIIVMDNGAGMDQEALKRTEELLKSDDPGIKNEYNWQSIGMKNIHDRLRYLYGEGYGVQVTSHQHVGTSVSVRMPVIRGEKYDENDHS